MKYLRSKEEIQYIYVHLDQFSTMVILYDSVQYGPILIPSKERNQGRATTTSSTSNGRKIKGQQDVWSSRRCIGIPEKGWTTLDLMYAALSYITKGRFGHLTWTGDHNQSSPSKRQGNNSMFQAIFFLVSFQFLGCSKTIFSTQTTQRS